MFLRNPDQRHFGSRWLRLPLTLLATGGCLLTVYDSLATENARVNQPRERLEAC